MNSNEEYLNQEVTIKIDRKLGTIYQDNEYTTYYPVNYGFVPNTKSDDGEEIDAYVLGVFEPVEEFTGKCIAVLHRTNDNDDKLIVAPEGKNYSNEEINALVEFQEQFFNHVIIRNEIKLNKLIPNLSVSNIASSREFYEKLGFKCIYERPERKSCFMELGGNQIIIEETNSRWSFGELKHPYGNGVNINISVDNIDEYYKNLKNKKVKFFINIESNNFEVNGKKYSNKEFLLQDVDGYLLRFNG